MGGYRCLFHLNRQVQSHHLAEQQDAIHVGHFDHESAMLAGLVHDIGVYYLFYRASRYEEYRNDHCAPVELVLGWHETIS